MKSDQLTVHEQNGCIYFTFPALDETGMVRHMFTSAVGGCSPEPYRWNFGLTGGDSRENILANYRKAAQILGISEDDFVVSAQVHGTRILRVGASERGKGVTRPRTMQGIDGLCTNEPGVALVTIHADCVPVFYLDPVRHVIALAHAGWRGTADRIAAVMVQYLHDEFGTQTKDLICAIGPSIGPERFIVRADVRDVFAERFPADAKELIYPTESPDEEARFRVDLWEANRRILIAAGVAPEAITVTDLCTATYPEVFHSFRITHTPGRMAAILVLRKQDEVEK